MRRQQLNNSVMAWLRCFEATARVGSFTQAATELSVTQGAISQQVRALEDRLGVLLFRRLPRRLLLTAEGEQLREVATSTLDQLESTLSKIQDRHIAGPLALSCYSSFALLWLMPRIGAFYREHPQIDLRVAAEFHLLEMATVLREGIDAAIRYDLGAYRDLESEHLLDEYLLPVASREFVKAHPQLRTPADLDPSMLLHDALAWPDASPDAEWRHWFGAVGVDGGAITATRGRRFNMAQLAVEAALNGQGVAIGRLALIIDHLREGRLLPLFGRAVPSPAAYRLVHVAQPRPRVDLLTDWLMQEAARFRQQREKYLGSLTHMDRPLPSAMP